MKTEVLHQHIRAPDVVPVPRTGPSSMSAGITGDSREEEAPRSFLSWLFSWLF